MGMRDDEPDSGFHPELHEPGHALDSIREKIAAPRDPSYFILPKDMTDNHRDDALDSIREKIAAPRDPSYFILPKDMTDHHQNDAELLGHIADVRGQMDNQTRQMQAFNNHPAIRAALGNAERYGQSPEGAIHQALDQNPMLQKAFAKMHMQYHELHQKILSAFEKSSGIQDPQARDQAQNSLMHGLNHMDQHSEHWPDPRKVANGKLMQNQDHGPIAKAIGKIVEHIARFISAPFRRHSVQGAVAAAGTESSPQPAPALGNHQAVGSPAGGGPATKAEVQTPQGRTAVRPRKP